MPIGQGCSWNTTLVKYKSSGLAAEAFAAGVDTLFAPVVKMVVDPRFENARIFSRKSNSYY
jgi:beta-glucosidase-like glycosyl hydrolase